VDSHTIHGVCLLYGPTQKPRSLYLTWTHITATELITWNLFITWTQIKATEFVYIWTHIKARESDYYMDSKATEFVYIWTQMKATEFVYIWTHIPAPKFLNQSPVALPIMLFGGELRLQRLLLEPSHSSFYFCAKSSSS
jgi:hypothetical protein